MKRIALSLLVCASLLLTSACIQAGHIDGGKDLLTAATMSDAEIAAVAQEMRAQGDKENKVASTKNKYGKRLAKLTNNLKNEDGLNLNFKVYLTSDINANASADGSIRVYSGLMDMLTDDELFYVIGHEIGHIKDGDTMDKMRMAYASSGALKAASATAGAKTGLSSAELSSMLHEVLNAQFSQKQEYEADEYGFNLMKKYGVDQRAAVSALMKIDKLGQSGGVMASHPNSADRAKRLEKKLGK